MVNFQMKGTHQSSSSSSEVYNESKASTNDSDDERWEDKLVIDLDANNMDTKQPKGAAAATADDSVESDGSNPSTKDQSIVTNSKNGRNENSSLGKPKGKRGGQKKVNENSKNENGSKPAGKMTKSDKEKATGAKPGRKKKEKLSPTPKFEINASELNSDDPYKFDQSDEKIAGIAVGKSNGKTKHKGEQKSCKDAQTEYDWRSVASVTEPENLGPCEPGTQVCLEGIVWQETNNGVLVVNVTWKGKTYMGTLLDATKHDWSPPSCDSPTGDFEGRTPKGRGKRSRVPLSDTFKDINERKLRKEMRKQSSQNQSRPKSPASPPKFESGKRKGRSSECDTAEPVSKRGRAIANYSNPPSPPTLIECPEPNCGKKYKQMNGLKYHQRNAHQVGSPQVASSDTTSEGADKVESVSSPEEPTKTKSANCGSKKVAEPARVGTKDCSSPDVAVEIPVKNNTTSVITPTANSLPNPTTPQSSNVPVAAVTPQVVKPANSSSDSNEQLHPNGNIPPLTSSAANRPLAISAPPKLISKPSVTNSTMAPISTITSPGVYNSTLKPIQPKPTILGEVTPNPALHDLMDQKKLKRKRSASKEDLLNAYNNMDTQKTSSGGIHKFDTEHRGLLSTGGMINSADPSSILQSPSYSDISEDGEVKNSMTRRELLSANRTNMTEGSIYPQPPYLVATVSPQKNAPVADKDGKKLVHRQPPSHSPAPSKSLEEKQHQKQMQCFAAAQQQVSWAATAAMNQELMLQMQNSANKDKSRISSSPKPNPFKNSTPSASSREMDNRASNDRLQLLKESMDMKASPMLNRHRQDIPRDYTISSNTPSQQSNDFNMYREMEQDHHKREMMKNLSPANKLPSSTTANKMADNSRYERMPRSSPMPPPTGYLTPFMANTFLPYGPLAGLSPNQMLSRVGAPFFPPGFNYSHLETLSADNKDNRNSASPSFTAKASHKIHELEGMQSSKSPRPVSSMSAKNQPITSQSAALHSAAAAMLGSYGPGLALYPPPK